MSSTTAAIKHEIARKIVGKMASVLTALRHLSVVLPPDLLTAGTICWFSVNVIVS